MIILVTNKAILKAFHDWGDWYRTAEYNLMNFEPWLEEKWGMIMIEKRFYKKLRGFYECTIKEEGKAALFMLKYND